MNTKNNSFSRSLLTTLLPKNSIIIEAGAHIGRDTVKLAALFPQGHVHAFEPNPHAYAQLIDTTKNINNITCYPYALSNKTGTAELQVSEQISALSSLHSPTKILQEKPFLSFHLVQVNTITINEWAQKHNINHIDFMWLDMQGHELAALQGAICLLQMVKALLVEVNLEQRYANQPLYQEIKGYLAQHNFYVYAEYLHHGSWGNALFTVKKSP